MIKKIFLALTLLSLSAFAHAQQTLTPTTFMDQWDQPQALNSETKWLIFTANKESGKWVKEYLEGMDVEDMAVKKWLYVADISGMPSLITKFMAIPKMKDYKFSIALEKEGEVSSDWPKQEGAVNVYQLNALAIDKVHTLTSADEVNAFLESIQ